MRVLVNAGPWLPVPPSGYGGIETVIATLIPELRRAGVHVTLATVGTSTIEADSYLHPLAEPQFTSIARPYNQVSGIAHAHMQGIVQAIYGGGSWDLVHDHLEVVGPAVFAAMGTAAPPVLQTLHWDLAKHAAFYESFDGRGRVRFAAVSQSQLDRAPQALRDQVIGVVPLAAPPALQVRVDKADHALVLARITRDKGQDAAVRICRQAGMPLVLAGPVAGIDDPAELDRRLAAGDAQLTSHPDVIYFQDEVRPLLDGHLYRWIGGVGGETKERVLRSARVLLAPNRWAEPGATGVVEALSRGVPVVGTPLGVLPSLVQHCRTGFLAAGEPELAGFLQKLDSIRAEDCIEAASEWTPEAMAASYLRLYDQILQENP
ncbi:glycosyltransferase involved in cell wall biosynthesis [Arthrobacter sp. PL16]|nr:glycosyltransferase involved in cell wall biosynthesis [Arthrobacter sp. PL16]